MSSKFKHIKIRLASPEEILQWSHGEVKKHETINYRTLKPEEDGLFCERIFGPMKDFQCSCGKKRNGDRGTICEKCGVEITEAKVRRERMGHIKLVSPVVHTWYLKNSPSRIAILLDLKAKQLEEVVYLASFIVIDPKQSGLVEKQIIKEHEYFQLRDKLGSDAFYALSGAEAIKEMLKRVDLSAERKILRKQLNTTSSKLKRDKVIKRLEVIEALENSDNKPEWMVLDVLPVIPPDLRPMVQLDGGRFATTDLNDLYRRILNRNNRLKDQIEKGAPHIIVKNEKRMLQEAVDSLIDNAKKGKKQNDRSRTLKSLSDMLRGKQGRFRQNLLGKRVDYSGRSVIIVGPDLKMYQCGIPRQMAVTLFKPFIMRVLIDRDGFSAPSAKGQIEKLTPRVWQILEEVVKEHPVLLNRAPTLHRLGIQAFEPKLIDGKAIRLHPLVTTAFNADFDGDQMPVHLPLSPEAQAEARLLMLASNNILNPKDGKPVVTPSQDMVLGNYYLTIEKIGLPNEGHFYANYEEAYLAYKNGVITLHTRIFLEAKSISTTKFTSEQLDKYILTTLGKIIFNNVLPDGIPYLNEPMTVKIKPTGSWHFIEKGKRNIDYKTFLKAVRYDKENTKTAPTEVAIKPFSKKFLSLIISDIFEKYKIAETSRILDQLKDLGFQYSTTSGITISAKDVVTLDEKTAIIEKSDKYVKTVNDFYAEGLLTEQERYGLVTKEWAITRDEIQSKLWNKLIQNKENHIYMMADSGARGSNSNFAQLAGMRGLMNNTLGQAMEVPVKANFLEGLSVSEFFISTHGARKGSTDTALKTAESGYLTRRLVDVSQDVIVEEEDCGTDRSVAMQAITNDDGKVIVDLFDRIIGRFAGKDVLDAKGNILIARNEYITNDVARDIVNKGVETVYIRSNLTCDSRYGLCKKCYGRNLATNEIVEVGEAVGVIAAQSIGEPGTQLTMRTFHTGGVASTGDITQGLPRIQELFEARNPKGKATISKHNGIVTLIENRKGNGLIVEIKRHDGKGKYTEELEAKSEMLISVGDEVSQGQQLNKGSLAPKELLKITDTETTQKYIVEEVQKVYCSQGVEISDKHIEIIVRQMMRKISVVIQGDTTLLPSSEISIHEFKEANQDVIDQIIRGKNKQLAVGRPVLLGITRAALKADSFLSACSFQETTRVLTDAAIKGKIDPLHGLKENVIVGGLIPAGTGILEEQDYFAESDDELEENEFEMNPDLDLFDTESVLKL